MALKLDTPDEELSKIPQGFATIQDLTINLEEFSSNP